MAVTTRPKPARKPKPSPPRLRGVKGEPPRPRRKPAQAPAPPLSPRRASPQPTGYAAIKERARARNAGISRAGRDIAPIPAVVNQPRRDACERDFLAFLNTYYRHVFYLPFSPDHLKVIAKAQQAVLHGGLFALAMPRGSGKTTIVEALCLWAAIYGHRQFVALIGSDAGHAEQMLDSIKVELESNDLLAGDFPEVCHAILKLEGIANRCGGQLCGGERTHITWTAREIVLPTIAGSKASGAIIKAAGLTGRIRGMKHKRADGTTVRPSLVVLDDPQTDESANSLTQCATRERIVSGAVLGLAGPGQKISGIMPCTVIAPGDLADSMLDRAKHPDWNGERMKMVYAFPTAAKLWEQYGEIRGDGLRAGEGLAPATAFYHANRPAMDEGSIVAWAERFNPDELSAIQHAMNLRLQDEHAFFAEYQNEPLPLVEEVPGLSADYIAGKLNRLERGVVPLGATHLVAFVDVHKALLYYVVAAFDDRFSGSVVEYGTHPDQKRAYFTLRDAQPTLADLTKGTGLEGVLFAGLSALVPSLLSRDWRREDGSTLKISRLGIDAHWDESSETVFSFCRRSTHAAMLLPTWGRGIGAKHAPMAMYKPRTGERVGQNWIIKPSPKGRVLQYDTNAWKGFCAERLGQKLGDKGSLDLFGDKATRHRLFAEHLTNERPVKVEANGRAVNEWIAKPGADQHWWDGLVACCVLASVLGAKLLDNQTVKKKVKLSEVQKRKRQGYAA